MLWDKGIKDLFAAQLLKENYFEKSFSALWDGRFR
jgi:hypothetical protein